MVDQVPQVYAYSFASPVTGLLGQAGQLVEDRAFAYISITGKGKGAFARDATAA
jgi:hypothetical protein